ncbi:MAG: DUF4292 domain-containing protein [Bacteroidetes bacterium]|nr:DUF4292 domain-containing protein [Bacteroidota bacterium]
MNKVWFATAFLVLLGASCRSTKPVASSDIPQVSAQELWQALDGSRLEFETFSTRADLDIEDTNGKSGASAMVRMYRDSLIWISLRKAGLEGARILITRDSLHILDRTAKTYYPLGFAQLRQQYRIDLGFEALQDLISGNALVRQPLDWTAGLDNGKLLLSGQDGGKVHRFWLRPSDLKLTAQSLEALEHPEQLPGQPGAQSMGMTMQLDAYEPVSDQTFATFRLLTVQGEMPASLQARFSKMAINEPELSFTFHINPGYTVVRDPKE